MFLDYHSGVSDQLFLDYGFLPETNRKDSLQIYAHEDELLQEALSALYKAPELRLRKPESFEGASEVGRDAMDVLRRVEDAFSELRPEEAEEGLVGSRSSGGGLAVMGGGRVEAKMVVGIAAMWHSVRYGGKKGEADEFWGWEVGEGRG